jgi:hypothetical protein
MIESVGQLACLTEVADCIVVAANDRFHGA